jgi:putative exporter of polyketide antibiotics
MGKSGTIIAFAALSVKATMSAMVDIIEVAINWNVPEGWSLDVFEGTT